jgi:hypothetical protein
MRETPLSGKDGSNVSKIETLESLCDAPAYEIVQACRWHGFQSPLDVRWLHVEDRGRSVLGRLWKFCSAQWGHARESAAAANHYRRWEGFHFPSFVRWPLIIFWAVRQMSNDFLATSGTEGVSVHQP